MEPARFEGPRKRRRPPKACEQCRKRKVRCDQNSPCNQCIRLKLDNCSYDPQTILTRAAKVLKHGPPANVAAGAPPTPISTTENQLSNYSLPASAAQSPIETQSDDASGTRQPYHHPSSELLQNTTLHVTQHNTRGAPWPSDAVPFEWRTDLHGTITKTRLLGRSHWMNIVQEFPFITQMQKLFKTNRGEEARTLLDRCKTLARTIKNQARSECKILENVRDHVPSKDLADNLLDNYLKVFESSYRILHVPSFRREYERYWAGPDSAAPIFIMKLLLVLAIGTCMADDQSIHALHNSALQWINVVQSWLSSPFTGKEKVSVSGIQIFCLLLLARETSSVGPDIAWISAGSLLRTAMLAGLHRDPSHFLRLSPLQAEMRRRLWATVMELCVQSSMNAGGSPLITSDMHDCRPPANLNDEAMNEDTGLISPSEENTTFTRTSLQIALLRTLPLRIQIAKMLNDFRNEQTFPETLQIDTRLSEMLRQLSSQLKSSRATCSSVTHDIDIGIYELMQYRFLLSLHQTFAMKAMADPMFYYSRKVILDTSLHILSLAFSAPSSSTTDISFRRILESTGGVYKNTIMVAFLMTSLDLVTRLERRERTPSSISDNLLQQEISRLLEAYRAHTLRRVQRGETNIKGHLFSCVGLEHLKALMEGDPNEARSTDAGMKAGHMVAEILEARVNDMKTPKAPLPDEHFGEDSGFPFGDDFGWDDWDPTFTFLDTNGLLSEI